MIIGASGATGKELAEQLRLLKHKVQINVRYTSKILEACKTDDSIASRVNVANFMAKIFPNQKLWNSRKGQMLVLYNKLNSSTNNKL